MKKASQQRSTPPPAHPAAGSLIQQPGRRLYAFVRAGFIAQGTTLALTASKLQVSSTFAKKVLMMAGNTPQMVTLRETLITLSRAELVASVMDAPTAAPTPMLLDPQYVYPGVQLYEAVREGFRRQGTSLTTWCWDHRLQMGNVRKRLLQSGRGAKAAEVRKQLVEASGALAVLKEQDPRIEWLWEVSP